MNTACCGLECANCDAYIAYKNDDLELKKKLAKTWNELSGENLTTEEVFCEGCKSSNRPGKCANCQVRSCCASKEIETCAQCEDFPCAEIEEIMEIFPAAKEALQGKNKKD